MGASRTPPGSDSLPGGVTERLGLVRHAVVVCHSEGHRSALGGDAGAPSTGRQARASSRPHLWSQDSGALRQWHVTAPTPSTPEGDLLWERGLHRCAQFRGGHGGAGSLIRDDWCLRKERNQNAATRTRGSAVGTQSPVTRVHTRNPRTLQVGGRGGAGPPESRWEGASPPTTPGSPASHPGTVRITVCCLSPRCTVPRPSGPDT